MKVAFLLRWKGGGALSQEAPQGTLQHVDLKKSSFRRGQGES